MRIRYLLALAGVLIAFAPAGTALAAAAEATPNAPAPCSTAPAGWFVNADETDREPTWSPGGGLFEAADLIHHNAPAGTTVDNLKPGSYAAAPAPDQPSFFSVEVAGTGTPSGYATLRWNPSAGTAGMWTMVTGGQQYEHNDPAELVKMTDPDKATTVVRFGVGYTKTPPGSVATLVSSVTFAGKSYDLTCKPPVEPTGTPSGSPSPSGTPSGSATPKPSTSTSPNPVAGGPTLPVTGPGVGTILGVGSVMLIAGIGAFLLATRNRRRGQSFEA